MYAHTYKQVFIGQHVVAREAAAFLITCIYIYIYIHVSIILVIISNINNNSNTNDISNDNSSNANHVSNTSNDKTLAIMIRQTNPQSPRNGQQHVVALEAAAFLRLNTIL